MEEDRVSTRRTLRRREEKVAKHLKRGANDKENKNFHKRVFRTPIDKPFEYAYYTHRLWMFFRETSEKEKDIMRIFCEAREKMRMRITLKKKSDPGKFAIPCPVKDGAFAGIVHFCGLFLEELRRNCERPRGADCGSSVQLPNQPVVSNTHRSYAHYDPIPVKKPQTIPRRINDPGIIAACHCGDEYETEYIQHEWQNDYYNPTIDAYTKQNIHTNTYDEDNEEERAIEYRAIFDEEDKLLHHSSWKRNAPSIDMTSWPSIDSQPQQRCRKRAPTDTAYYKSVDTDVNRAREGNYSIGSWADEHHHESFAVETATYAPEADKLQDSFTDEELLNMQRRDDTYQIQAEAAWERTRFSQSIDTRHQQSIDTRRPQSIDINNTTSIDNHLIPKTTVSEKDKSDKQYLTPDELGIFRDPDGYAREIDGRTLHASREDITYILQTANGADNLFMHHRNTIEQKATKEFYDTAEFGRRAYDLYGHRKFYSEEKDEYGVYRDDQRYARDLDGNTIRLHSTDIRRVLERASRDEPSYICLPEHANLFTQTKLIPEIYTKDEIDEMFYGVSGEHERNKEAFQMKLDGVYYPLNDSISWLTTCMEEIKQDIARIQNATDTARPPSIDRRQPQLIDSRRLPSIDRHHHTSIENCLTASIDTNPPHPHMMKSQPDFHTR
ncbi:hypothetical protein F2Q69_00029499 [Brassica cretica]|uniref:Uncharacterized protein n=1 Tax=Brassica cretica TaxID=69181 RepID=A0A8S9RR09_BRACR|nr:hypothetical protein F2Q69_00029499 [Brassica cretica]